MATPSQIDANRRNALLSTGPRTAEGKSASSANALKHGLSAAFRVFPGESQQEFDSLAAATYSAFSNTRPTSRAWPSARSNATTPSEL